VESFSGVVTEALRSDKNTRTRVEPRLLQLRYCCSESSEEMCGKLRCICCYCHELIVKSANKYVVTFILPFFDMSHDIFNPPPPLLLLTAGLGANPAYALQPFKAYCANPALVPPFISRGAAHQTA
jgi:hypothetical protein